MSEAGWIVALWALLIPIILMAIVLCVPYAFMVLVLYLLYGDTALAYWGNTEKVIFSIEKLVDYGMQTEGLTLMDFYLPVFGSMAFGILLTIAIVYVFLRYVRNIFRV